MRLLLKGLVGMALACLRRYICGGFMIIQNNEFTCHGMFSDQCRTEISLLLNYYEN
ncbi:hypothetical protein [Escherichia coli]|uniref:hypothetical protein n=1 Tax=Escherichia coli TaxID=562 RepID=UPI002A3BFDE0|nr:hypothetical protein [Escherichia coli]